MSCFSAAVIDQFTIIESIMIPCIEGFLKKNLKSTVKKQTTKTQKGGRSKPWNMRMTRTKKSTETRLELRNGKPSVGSKPRSFFIKDIVG